ncbi:MAG TPA: hypothetical protein VI282_20305 [Verrucomicrobiae bacterium]
MVLAETAIGRNFELRGHGFVRNEVQLENLYAGLIAKDFPSILQAFARKCRLDFCSALAAGWNERFDVR